MRWRYFLFVTIILLPPLHANEHKPLFRVNDLYLPERIDADVLLGFLANPKQANLIITQITQDYQRSIKIFSMNKDGQYTNADLADIEIADDVIFMDVGKVRDSQLDSIILFRRDAAWWLDPVNGKEYRLLEIDSIYQNAIKDKLPHFDVVKDINGDSLDDILLPSFDGYQLFIQTAPGEFSDPILVGPPPTMKTTDEYAAIVYKHSSVNLVDVNFDGKNDLIFWDAPDLKVFKQQEDGRFSGEYQLLALGMELEDVGAFMERMGKEDQSNIQARTFHKVLDVNADKRPDLMTQTITSKGVFSKRTTFEFFMGTGADTKISSFSDQPDTQIHSTGIQISPQEKDFNNDGKTDVVIASIDFGVGMILKALLTGSITIDLDFYQQSSSGFPNEPNVKRKMKIKFSLSSGDFNAPIILIEDTNGDQLLDLLVSDESAFQISYGDNSDRLFSRDQHRFDVPMPGNPDLVDTFDLNSDGKMDIILRYREDERNLEKMVKVLIAN